MPTTARTLLIRLLQGAYSGELAAAFAYRGHWKAVKNAEQKQAIRKIEDEEWHHRRLVGHLLQQLHSRPNRCKEILMFAVGKTLGAFCFLAGWFWPMFFAGRLETANVGEYSSAARFAGELGLTSMQIELEKMAMTELEHEKYFYEIIREHWLLPHAMKIFRARPIYSAITAIEYQSRGETTTPP